MGSGFSFLYGLFLPIYRASNRYISTVFALPFSPIDIPHVNSSTCMKLHCIAVVFSPYPMVMSPPNVPSHSIPHTRPSVSAFRRALQHVPLCKISALAQDDAHSQPGLSKPSTSQVFPLGVAEPGKACQRFATHRLTSDSHPASEPRLATSPQSNEALNQDT